MRSAPGAMNGAGLDRCSICGCAGVIYGPSSRVPYRAAARGSWYSRRVHVDRVVRSYRMDTCRRLFAAQPAKPPSRDYVSQGLCLLCLPHI